MTEQEYEMQKKRVKRYEFLIKNLKFLEEEQSELQEMTGKSIIDFTIDMWTGFGEHHFSIEIKNPNESYPQYVIEALIDLNDILIRKNKGELEKL